MVPWYKAFWPDDNRKRPYIFDLRTEYLISIEDPLTEAIRAVEKIVKTHPGPYTLMMSGGIDSQAMVYAWKLSGHPFKIVHYSYGTNVADTASVVEFCSNEKLDYEIIDFDVVHFLNSQEYRDMARQYDCASPHLLTHMKITSFHEETCVMGGNYVTGPGVSLDYTIHGLDRFRHQSKQNFVPFFLMSTPELAYSFLMKPGADSGLTNDKEYDASYFSKIRSYINAGFHICPQRHKMTGFEEIKDMFDSFPVDPRTKMLAGHFVSTRPFDILFRYGMYAHLKDGAYSLDKMTIHNQIFNSITYIK